MTTRPSAPCHYCGDVTEACDDDGTIYVCQACVLDYLIQSTREPDIRQDLIDEQALLLEGDSA